MIAIVRASNFGMSSSGSILAGGGGWRERFNFILTSADVLQAVLAVLPLDDFETPASWTMQVVGDADAVPPAAADLRQALADAGEGAPGSLERFAFYERAGTAVLILQSGELRKYGNILLRKGVLAED